MLNSYTFASSRIKIRVLIQPETKEKSLHSLHSQKKIIFLSKNPYHMAIWPKMHKFHQVCIWINEDGNNKFKIKQNQNQILLHTLRSMKNWILNQNTEKSGYYLKQTTIGMQLKYKEL